MVVGELSLGFLPLPLRILLIPKIFHGDSSTIQTGEKDQSWGSKLVTDGVKSPQQKKLTTVRKGKVTLTEGGG